VALADMKGSLWCSDFGRPVRAVRGVAAHLNKIIKDFEKEGLKVTR